jgi:hypothetical protein
MLLEQGKGLLKKHGFAGARTRDEAHCECSLSTKAIAQSVCNHIVLLEDILANL